MPGVGYGVVCVCVYLCKSSRALEYEDHFFYIHFAYVFSIHKIREFND